MDATHAFQIAADTETFAEPTAALPPKPATFAEALTRYERAQALVQRTDSEDPTFEGTVDLAHELLIDLFRTPVPDLATLAHKLALFAADDRHEFTRAPEITKALEEDAKRLTQAAAERPDKRFNDAFDYIRVHHLSSYDLGEASVANAHHAVLANERATTPAAIARKLRIALFSNTGESWLERAALNLEVPGFEEMLRADDCANQLLWSAILDLEAPTISADVQGVIDRYREAERVFNATPSMPNDPSEAPYLAAVDQLDSCVPQSAAEFVRLFAVRYGDGLMPTEDQIETLVEQARRLVAA